MKFKLILISVLFALSCSSVQRVYNLPDYEKNSSEKIKRIFIIIKNDTADESKSRAFSMIATDMVKSNTNYIIKGSDISKNNISETNCAGYEGIAFFTIIDSEKKSSKKIKVKGELYKCSAKILIWSAIAETDLYISGDKKLENMSLMYEDKLNKIDGKAGKYAPAMFSVLYDIIKTMPNPELTDEEVNEKIETETSDSTFYDYFINLPARTSS